MKKIALFLCFFVGLNAFNIQGQDKKESKSYRIVKNLDIFNTVLRELDQFYVDSIDIEDLVETGLRSMLQKLDPYTIYMPSEMNDDLKMMTTGEYAGIGAYILQTKKGVVISEPYEGFPAQRNGLRAGDLLLEIDGVDVRKKKTSEVSELLKGKNGTKISLKIGRKGERRPIKKHFLRENIQFPSIPYSHVYNGNTGYILLSDFTDKSAYELKRIVKNMIVQDSIKSLVIDLRDNGGGLINEAVKIAGYFLPKGTKVVTTKGKNPSSDYVYRTPSTPIFADIRLAVLVNSSSASASEILSGALQDLDRAIVLGERTYGKGLVQSVRPVGYDSNVKITTGKYYIPSGRCVQVLDYSHRNDDGSVGRIPDSLTSEFQTKNGRIVRDGGGITPDSITTDKRILNIAYYIMAQNLYFDYATDFVLKHPTIASPEVFQLSDEEYNNFVNYLINEKKFTYTTQAEKYLDNFTEMAKYEGFGKLMTKELEALQQKITPDIKKNLYEYRDDVIEFLVMELMKRYYYQKGQIRYTLRNDKELKTAIDIVNNRVLLEEILNSKNPIRN